MFIDHSKKGKDLYYATVVQHKNVGQMLKAKVYMQVFFGKNFQFSEPHHMETGFHVEYNKLPFLTK